MRIEDDWCSIARPVSRLGPAPEADPARTSFERHESDNLIVQVTLDDGSVGFGEGVPRGPTLRGRRSSRHSGALTEFDLMHGLGTAPSTFAEAVRAIGGLSLPQIQDDPRGMAGNSARCALELALLDAYGRAFDTSINAAVRLLVSDQAWLNPKPAPVRYSGAITAESRRGETISAWNDAALRLPPGQGQGRGGWARRRSAPGADPPASWIGGSTSGSTPTRRGMPTRFWTASAPSCPAAHRSSNNQCLMRKWLPWGEIRAQLEALAGPKRLLIMLDESLCGYPDAVNAVDLGLADVLNIRLSKCGGIGPTPADLCPGAPMRLAGSTRLPPRGDGLAFGGGAALRE